jgi:plastocyanin
MGKLVRQAQLDAKGPPGMRGIALALATLGAALTVVAGASATASAGKLVGTDGPGFTITLSAKSVKAGSYTITVKDRSKIHNFHLIGPGVNKKTSVGAVGTFTWKVTLKKGTYRFICDPHASFMKGTLKVT